MSGELEKRIITNLQAFESQVIHGRQLKLPREMMERLAYGMSQIVGDMRKEFLDIEETELPIKVHGEVDWKKTAELMELRNIIRLKWFVKWLKGAEKH